MSRGRTGLFVASGVLLIVTLASLVGVGISSGESGGSSSTGTEFIQLFAICAGLATAGALICALSLPLTDEGERSSAPAFVLLPTAIIGAYLWAAALIGNELYRDNGWAVVLPMIVGTLLSVAGAAWVASSAERVSGKLAFGVLVLAGYGLAVASGSFEFSPLLALGLAVFTGAGFVVAYRRRLPKRAQLESALWSAAIAGLPLGLYITNQSGNW